jgi:biotin operon repressor
MSNYSDDYQTKNTLLEFFKALSDANRLRMVGILALEPHSVEALAAKLELSNSTTSHHLSRLSKLGLVEGRSSGHYNIYSLKVEVLSALTKRLLGQGNLQALATPEPASGLERQVLRAFTDAEGRITAFPVRRSKMLVLLRYTLESFEPGRRYSEKEVNEIFSRFSLDTAALRRGMIENGLMAREGGGGEYWRLE